jgi:hypothetical protein
MRIDAPPRERMFFLLGRGRSGTTLLRSLLDAHPSIAVAPEALFVMSLHRRYSRGTWTPQRIRSFHAHAFLERRLRRWNVTRADLEARALSSTSEPSFADLSAELYESHADACGKQRGRWLGDKNPRYSLCVDSLREVFPSAKFVHLVRDYRDNVLSFRDVPFDLSSPAALAHRWVRYNAAIVKAASAAPEFFHQIRFEDLVNAPAPTLASLCGFLGVEATVDLLDGERATDMHGAAWHRHLGRPVDATLAGRWRHELTHDQVATLDGICQPLAARFGYEPAHSISRRASRISPGAAVAWGLTTLERVVFRLPIGMQVRLNDTYRRLTGNVIP